MSKKEEQPAAKAAVGGTAAPPVERKTVEQWREQLKTPDWQFAAAMVGVFKAEGREVTERQYIAAIKHTINEPCGYTTAGIGVARGAHRAIDPLKHPEKVDEYERRYIRKLGGSK